jgi:phage-related protein
VIAPKFEIEFLEDAVSFLQNLNDKAAEKIIYNADKSRYHNDPKLFKKLTDEIWEFRTKYAGIQYRLLAFWDKTTPLNTLVIATHGIIKKTSGVPEKDINKATELRRQYFENSKNYNQ